MKATVMFLKNIAIALVFGIPVVYAQVSPNKSSFPAQREIQDQSEMKPDIGVRFGVVSPTENYNNAAEYGIEAGYQPYIPFGLGIELDHYFTDHRENAVLNVERTRLLARGTYNFGGDIPVVKNSYLGLGLGPVFDNLKGQAALNLGVEALAGADFFLTRKTLDKNAVSLGANINYLFVNSLAANTFTLNGAVKYWF